MRCAIVGAGTMALKPGEFDEDEESRINKYKRVEKQKEGKETIQQEEEEKKNQEMKGEEEETEEDADGEEEGKNKGRRRKKEQH